MQRKCCPERQFKTSFAHLLTWAKHAPFLQPPISTLCTAPLSSDFQIPGKDKGGTSYIQYINWNSMQFFFPKILSSTDNKFPPSICTPQTLYKLSSIQGNSNCRKGWNWLLTCCCAALFCAGMHLKLLWDLHWFSPAKMKSKGRSTAWGPKTGHSFKQHYWQSSVIVKYLHYSRIQSTIILWKKKKRINLNTQEKG